MIPHICPSCSNTSHLPEVNDDVIVEPKLRVDELIQIYGHGRALFRITKMQGMTLELEKL
jgi:hypothetical protein